MGSCFLDDMESAFVLRFLLFGLVINQTISQNTPQQCCNVKMVKDAPAGMKELEGEYELKETSNNKLHENCADNCVFTKEGEDYCFMDVPKKDAADITCDETVKSTSGGETTRPKGTGVTTPRPLFITTGSSKRKNFVDKRSRGSLFHQ